MTAFSPILVLGVCCILFTIHVLTTRRTRREDDAFVLLPWVGLPKGPFAKLRALLDPASVEEAINVAYHQYSAKGTAFIMTSWMWAPIVVLPPSLVPWIVSQPDNVLNFQEAVTETLTFNITSLDEMISTAPTHVATVAGPLTRSLALTVEPVMDEVMRSIDNCWGKSPDFVSIEFYETIVKVAACISNRVFVGEELCHNEDFLDNSTKLAHSVASSGVMLRVFPTWFQDKLGWLFVGKNREHFDRIFEHLGPKIDELKRSSSEERTNPEDGSRRLGNLLEWLVDNARSLQDPREWSTQLIAKRYTIVMFAALHTTAFTMYQLILDLVHAAPEHNAIESLREELAHMLKQTNGRWTKAGLSQLVKMDSAIRESMRVHPIGNWSLRRLVVNNSGLFLPDGVHISKGTRIAVAAINVHRDDNIYPNARSFDPFRFYRARQEKATENGAQSNGKVISAVSSDDTFFAFGHGRHVCPGRFFAVQEVKLILAYVLLSYDIQPLQQRPQDKWIGDMVIPDADLRISVRRR